MARILGFIVEWAIALGLSAVVWMLANLHKGWSGARAQVRKDSKWLALVALALVAVSNVNRYRHLEVPGFYILGDFIPVKAENAFLANYDSTITRALSAQGSNVHKMEIGIKHFDNMSVAHAIHSLNYQGIPVFHLDHLLTYGKDEAFTVTVQGPLEELNQGTKYAVSVVVPYIKSQMWKVKSLTIKNAFPLALRWQVTSDSDNRLVCVKSSKRKDFPFILKITKVVTDKLKSKNAP